MKSYVSPLDWTLVHPCSFINSRSHVSVGARSGTRAHICCTCVLRSVWFNICDNCMFSPLVRRTQMAGRLRCNANASSCFKAAYELKVSYKSFKVVKWGKFRWWLAKQFTIPSSFKTIIVVFMWTPRIIKAEKAFDSNTRNKLEMANASKGRIEKTNKKGNE